MNQVTLASSARAQSAFFKKMGGKERTFVVEKKTIRKTFHKSKNQLRGAQSCDRLPEAFWQPTEDS
jgi:hypothetical protein